MIKHEKTLQDFSDRAKREWVYVTVSHKHHPVHGGADLVYRGVATLVENEWDTDKIIIHFSFAPYPYTVVRSGDYFVRVKALHNAVSWASVYERF